MTRTSHRRIALIAAVSALALGVAACGTREPHAAVIKAAGGGPVTITTTGGGSAGTSSVGGSGGSSITNPTTGGKKSGAITNPSSGGGGSGSSSITNPSTGGGTVSGNGGAGSSSSSGKSNSSTASGSANPTTSGGTCTKQGSPIVFGQVGTFSGIIGASEGSAAPGLKIWAAATNAAGGIACHPVTVDSIDDGGSAGQAESAAQTLIQNDHAVAINAFVPVTLNGIENVVDKANVPVVGGDGLASQWTTDPDFYSAGSSFKAVIYSFLKAGAMAGGKKYSFLYCIEATPCTAAQNLVTKQGLAKQAGLTGVGDQPISLAQSSFVQQCATAKSKGANVVIIGAGATAVSAVGRDCASQNYHPIYITESLAAVNSLESDPNLSGLTIGLTSFPWMVSTTPAEKAFQAAIQKYDPSLDNGGGAAGAYTDGELLNAAILSLGKAAYGNITAAMVVQGLHNLHHTNLNGLAPGFLDFSHGGNTHPDNCAFIAAISHLKWGAPLGNHQICEP